ncbi:hypothetical protein W97_04677 [Coniosporium apollinis CBS 100218]|uniref:Kinetochore protein mis14 n=1 Tax=Coniosporium apollinis (strain CBS 100218) TaxID=1168221 RepID=R7YUF3_CONA1|nr:uncharacterized protein W97_04677 [Coniosporium apollinis CBS 100218]EON65439.1 hypothetical protein W97_04677 [Coniosporium apollinis CBS 100218]
MDTAHRKIELQSPADFAYLQSNALRAARQKIDLHLPPSAAPAGEDALRRRVEELVDEYIRTTFARAQHNISINGLEAAEAQEPAGGEEYEPYDSRLSAHLQSLERRREDLTAQVADLRRTAPLRAAQAFQTSFTRESETLDTKLKAEEEALLAQAEKEGRLDIGQLQRWDEVQAMWERGTEGLVGLKGLTETVARLERAEGVVGYLERK